MAWVSEFFFYNESKSKKKEKNIYVFFGVEGGCCGGRISDFLQRIQI